MRYILFALVHFLSVCLPYGFSDRSLSQSRSQGHETQPENAAASVSGELSDCPRTLMLPRRSIGSYHFI